MNSQERFSKTYEWSPTEIGELPEIAFGDQPIRNFDYYSLYYNLIFLKNCWVYPPETLTHEKILNLQKRIEVAAIANIYRAFGFNISGTDSLDNLVTELLRHYPEGLREVRTNVRQISPISYETSIAMIVNFLLNTFIASKRSDSRFINEQELLKGKEILFLSGLMAKGLSYALVHFIRILRSRGEDQASILRNLNENFSFSAVDKGLSGRYIGGVSENLITNIVDAFNNKKDIAIIISDDVIALGNSSLATIRSIIEKLKNKSLPQEAVETFIRSIYIDIFNHNLAPAQENDKYFYWIVKDPTSGNETKIEIKKSMI